jgi:hypothetical protein
MSDPRLNFKISATAELQALKATEAELIRTISAGQAAEKTFKDLREETAQLAAVQCRMKDMGFGGRMGSEIIELLQNIPILGRVMTAANGGVGLLSVTLGGLAVTAGGKSQRCSFTRHVDRCPARATCPPGCARAQSVSAAPSGFGSACWGLEDVLRGSVPGIACFHRDVRVRGLCQMFY